MDSALNNLQRLICNKTNQQPIKTTKTCKIAQTDSLRVIKESLLTNEKIVTIRYIHQ